MSDTFEEMIVKRLDELIQEVKQMRKDLDKVNENYPVAAVEVSGDWRDR